MRDKVISQDVQAYGVCNTCTIMLVRLAYERAWWFRLIREPLRLGMILLGWLHRINPKDYQVRTLDCHGCIRFTKTALKEKSDLFCWLNDRVNPVFNLILETLVTQEEIQEAKRYARQATHARK